jgi:hypothetical protein
MRSVIWIIFALSFLILNICLLMPMVNRGMSWEEAALGLIPSAFVALICFVLLLAGVGAKEGSRSRASRLWAAALLWSLLAGGIVTFATMSSYQSNISAAQSERAGDSRRSSSSLYQTYARYDQIGMMFGWATLGFAGVSLVGLIVSIAMKKPKPA